MNQWMETVLKFKTNYNLTLMEAIQKAKQHYIKRSQIRKLEKELNKKIDYL